MGELDILRHIYAQNDALPDRVSIPPGDDMAAVTIHDRTVLITVDQVADGVHVDVANTPIELVGRKAITRNLSDVAAMAAVPTGAVVAGALPRSFGDALTQQLFNAMRDTAEQYACPLIGGDTMLWDGPLMLTVTILAEPQGVEPVRRSGACGGDIVFVTGALGNAWRQGGPDAPHLRFEPRIELARQLAQLVPLHSMIDLSDGLATDLKHICEQSGVDAEVEVARLPLRADAATDNPDAWMTAMCDGEDYELCFTVEENHADRIPESVDGVPVTRVGRVVARDDEAALPSLRVIHPDGRVEAFVEAGWEHV